MEVFDMCFIRLGNYSFERRWLDRDISESLTAAAGSGILALGILVGLLIGWCMRGDSWREGCGGYGIGVGLELGGTGKNMGW